jgi:hypothetical protein
VDARSMPGAVFLRRLGGRLPSSQKNARIEDNHATKNDYASYDPATARTWNLLVH